MTQSILTGAYHGYANSSTLPDSRQYAALTERMSLPPTSFMVLHSGESGRALYERYGYDFEVWKWFRREVNHHYPNIPTWTTSVARDGRILASVPERRVYEMLCSLLPASVRVEVHPPFGPTNRRRCADFRLTDHSSTKRVHIEVAGMISKDGTPRLPAEAKYRKDLVVKLEAYAAAKESPPVLIFIDEVCGEPSKLRARLNQVINELQGCQA